MTEITDGKMESDQVSLLEATKKSTHVTSRAVIE